MRIYLKVKSDGSTVPFNHLKKLTGTIHKWIGKQNEEHGDVSLYSFSWLNGGKKSNKGDGLVFENGSSFFISAYDNDLLHRIIDSIQKDSSMFCGLSVFEIIIQNNPDFSEKENFCTASPVFVKRKIEDKVKHYDFNEAETADFLKETLVRKMEKAGFSDDTLEISFDLNYAKAKSKVVHYGNIKNKANVCPVVIKAKPETKAFIWNVGVGNSTGVGFGALK